MRTEYSSIPATAGPTHTEPNQVGVSFSGHRAAVFESGGHTVERDIPPGSVFVTGPDPISWTHIREHTEAMEIYPDLGLLASLADGPPALRPAAATRDGTVLAIASILKRVHTTGCDLSDVAASTLAHRIAEHILDNHAGRTGRSRPGRLDRRTVDRVASFVDAELSGELTLDRLAAVATLSPFHFARAFKATTGLAPHQFVMSRRIERARTLLITSRDSVVDISHAVGLSNVSHFRRVFRGHTGVLPGEVRKIGPSARPARRAIVRP